MSTSKRTQRCPKRLRGYIHQCVPSSGHNEDCINRRIIVSYCIILYQFPGFTDIHDIYAAMQVYQCMQKLWHKRLQEQFSSCFEAQIPLSAGLASAAQSLNPALRAVPELAESPGGWLIHTFFAGLSVNLIHDQNCQPKTRPKKKQTHVTSSLFFFSSCPAKRSSDQVIELAVCQRHAAVQY